LCPGGHAGLPHCIFQTIQATSLTGATCTDNDPAHVLGIWPARQMPATTRNPQSRGYNAGFRGSVLLAIRLAELADQQAD
jgi:hypothetical protein